MTEEPGATEIEWDESTPDYAGGVILFSENINTINLFIYGLFKGAVSSSDDIARNSRMFSE
jgi:hypothetical protein